MPRDLFGGDPSFAPQSQTTSSSQAPIQQQAPPQQGIFPSAMLNNVAGSAPIQGILGMGDSVRNLLSLGTLSNYPSGAGPAYQVGQLAGDIGGFIGGGEALDAARGLGEALPYVGQSLQQLGGSDMAAGALRRILGSSMAGAAINPNDRLHGATTGAALGTAGEALPYAISGAGALSEKLVPRKFAANLIAGDGADVYNTSKDAADSLYNPIMNKYGTESIINQPNINTGFNSDITNPISNLNNDTFMSLKPEIESYFSPQEKVLVKQYTANPTFQNAHDLQSQFGSEASDLQGQLVQDAYTKNAIQAKKMAQNAVQNDMQSYLTQQNPADALQYQTARNLYRQEVGPFLNGGLIQKAVQGKTSNIDPYKVETELKGLQDSGAIPQGHYLNSAYSQLAAKNDAGKTLGSMLGMGAGAIGGTMEAGGFGGLGGAFAGKVVAPAVIKLLTSPTIANAVTKYGPTYGLAAKGLIGANLQNN